MPPHTLINRQAREFADAQRAERDADVAALLAATVSMRCVEGRVYANRTVRRGDARRYDRAHDYTVRWC
jgi:hypothetical protein